MTKWVEAKAVKTADAKQTVIFLYENIISRFGCPKILINDRGTHFINVIIEQMTTLFNINHRKTIPYHPQTNGQTKRINQTLVCILYKIVVDSKCNWDTKLTAALWAYQTTYNAVFLDVWNWGYFFPIKFEVQTLCIAMEYRLDDFPSLKN